MDGASRPRSTSAFGRVDVLVNNAGIAVHLPGRATSTPARWRRVLDVNLTGPFLLCQAFGRHMLAAGAGSIVNIASVAGLLGVADRAAYNASKHGLIGLTRTLAVEWGGRGVRVNAVCPGWVKTAMDDASQARGRATATPTSPTTCRSAGSPSPTTWRRRSRSWPTRPAAASSTARRSRSTAAGTPTAPGSRYACAARGR